MSTQSSLVFLVLLIFTGALTGCASTRMSDRKPDQLFQEERYDDAAEHLKKGLEDEKDGDDQLLYLLDVGLSLHSAGKYQESNKYFLEAEKIADIKDYTSLADEAGTLLTSENIKDYKGEDFEKVLINTYLAINFTMLGNEESALVEARKVNRKLNLMITEGKRKYQQSAFARYLSAILYEDEGSYDDAYIDYKRAYELLPDFPLIGRDLWRAAYLADRREDLEKWESRFGPSVRDLESARAMKRRGARQGELIVLYENGISPLKHPNPQFNTLPKFYPRYNPVRSARIEIREQDRTTAEASVTTETQILEDIEATAIRNLDEKYGAMIAKKLAGIVAKEVAAKQIENATDSPLAGFLAKIFFYVSDTADIRSWSLLPRDLQLARIPLSPGTYKVRIQPIGSFKSFDREVKIAPGRKSFLNVRYMP